MGITYQEELFENIISELPSILNTHWEELANNKDIRPLDVDYAFYILANRQDFIKIFTVRDDKKLIGYASFVIKNNPHYKTWKYAVSDVYYLDKVYRKTGIGLEMFRKIEDWLKSFDVKSITVQDKLQHSHNSLFVKLGFTPIEQNYEKVF